MTTYFIGGIAVAILSFIVGIVWYANRAGRNSARVRSEAEATSAANEEAASSRRALAARTNGIRSNNQLLGTLDKGEF
ncbi:hypothetical protein NQF87_08355 [Bombella sp. TMW 2.2559]|uniref:Pilus assembly protein n=1 Tax=Bombella dulcis TaxID=2967339 RepID=A0ABT3WD20_9PROT|nr:hypothetical protein [Bombella dulcis]MCX5616977.1 hypothetical protein [Bombella dulcis]